MQVQSNHKINQISEEQSQVTITVEVVTLDIPNKDVMSQAFEKIRKLDNWLKPIVLEGLAKKLKSSKKTLEKSFELWAMERIAQIAATQENQNEEGR